MKEIGKILAYLVATVLLGAVIAPPLFWAGQWVAGHGVLLFLKETNFQRFFDRAMLIAAVLLLWPVVSWLHIREWRELGLRRDPHPWRRFASGLLLSAGSMFILAAILVATDRYHFRTGIRWKDFAMLPLTAIVVAVIEEGLFRGALQGFVQRSATPPLAITSVAALYSVVHFLKPPENAMADSAVGWASGFVLLSKVFWQFHQPLLVIGGFSTLFVIGVILGYTRVRTASLWMPIGLHAGWIFAKFGFGKVAKHSGDLWPWFGPDILIGIGPVLFLLGVGLLVRLWLRYVDR